MKCPECGKDQKRKDGMTCKYQFVLDPKQPPNLTGTGIPAAGMDNSIRKFY